MSTTDYGFREGMTLLANSIQNGLQSVGLQLFNGLNAVAEAHIKAAEIRAEAQAKIDAEKLYERMSQS